MKGLRWHKGLALSWGALLTSSKQQPSNDVMPIKSTVINIERGTDERTPLLKECKSYDGITIVNVGYGSQVGVDSSYGSEIDGYSIKEGVHQNVASASLGKQNLDCYSCVQIMIFVLILASACVIATYLLINESRFPPTKYSLDLVHRDIWSNVAMPLADILNHTKVLNIVIMQTGGPNCDKFNNCLHILRDLQKKYQTDQHSGQEIPFNFLIGGNQQTYEARGWKYQSGLPFVAQNVSLVVAVIGNYTTLAPSAIQLHSILSLITESVRLKKLQRHYKIYGLQNMRNNQTDGVALFKAIGQLKHFVGLLQFH
ncbi:peptidoglycan recognition protein [Eurosta solidaginis]|uniref:peptidoglycan recognition protein n=1 Tax=Eurosta solidaginis TaxID=178769 RepID=UPI0035310921